MFFMKKKAITVQNTEISIRNIEGSDYVCLTDMVKNIENGGSLIEKWLRNKNTIEFLGVWESMYNPNFNSTEFEGIKNEAGSNRFILSTKQWIEKTNSIGIKASAGRYGGTYAHVDIAFEFGSWISPQFKLYLIKEYERLKAIENNQYNLEWDVKRVLSKANYSLHTDAVKDCVIPQSKKWIKSWEYTEEADFLNLAVFGMTAKEWRDKNPTRAKNGENLRDSASINELLVISNLESLNASMMRDGLSKQERFEKLQAVAQQELIQLSKYDFKKSIKKLTPETYLEKDSLLIESKIK